MGMLEGKLDKKTALLMSENSQLMGNLEKGLAEKGYEISRILKIEEFKKYFGKHFDLVIMDDKYKLGDWYDFVDLIKTKKVVVYSVDSNERIFAGDPKDYERPRNSTLEILGDVVGNENVRRRH